jgi:hypothetical protein
MEVKLIRENPDGSADFSFDMSTEEKEALLCLGIITGLKRGIEEGKKYVAPPADEDTDTDGQDSGTL